MDHAAPKNAHTGVVSYGYGGDLAALAGPRLHPPTLPQCVNGYVLDLHATVGDTYDDVQQVSYTLHVPVGTSVTSEVDPAVLDPKDTFQYYADEPAGTYNATVKVSTGTPKKPVSAATDLVAVTGMALAAASVSGQSPQMLQMAVSA